MDNNETDLFGNITEELKENEEKEEVDLAGYQVTKAELFSQIREPSVTVWIDRIKFNMACLKKFPGVTHVQLLVNPEQKRLIVRPCDKDAPDSLRWCSGGGEKEIKNRDMLCRIFAAKLFELMEWNPQYRYRMLGKPAVCGTEALYLFKLSDFEMYVLDSKTRKTKRYLPENWREYFGTPVAKHEEEYKIDLADGYLTTDKA